MTPGRILRAHAKACAIRLHESALGKAHYIVWGDRPCPLDYIGAVPNGGTRFVGFPIAAP